MPLSNSLLSYEDVRGVLERALASPHGIRVNRASRGMAISFRQRIYKFRQLDRINNTKIYNEGDPLYGSSVYDTLVADVVDTSVVIKKLDAEMLLTEIEELEE